MDLVEDKNDNIKENVSNCLEYSKNIASTYTGKNSASSTEIAKRNSIWDIDLILSKIFAYSDIKDLIKLNTVCKRWCHLTRSIIYRRIKLLRSRDIISNRYMGIMNTATMRYAEIDDCISNNAIHAHLIKEFTLSEQIQSKNIVNFFKVFSFIENLTLSGVKMCQGIFLDIINPLTHLRELNLERFHATWEPVKGDLWEAVQLPSSLTKLTLSNVHIEDDPPLFIKTINSHRNLIEFSFKGINHRRILDQFIKLYPTLKYFEYRIDHRIENIEFLYSILEFNPQLLALKLELQKWRKALINNINRHLTNLQEFSFESAFKPVVPLDDIFYFSLSSKIKKLKLSPQFLTSNSLNSVLKNCPELIELSLICSKNHLYFDNYTLNISAPINISKLEINFTSLADTSFDSILIFCAHLKVLDIKLPINWLDWMNIIRKRCSNLEQLTLSISIPTHKEQHEFYEALSNNSAFSTTLTHLTFKDVSFHSARAEYFANFPNLKSIKFLALSANDISQFKKNEAEKNMWRNFDVVILEIPLCYFNIKLIKVASIN
ncbi:hypothetical protein CONCODRAFT_12602 [Conidiobolus coronatus NRRL 28638]|uniref:F-box domain-containing protein n=1 Tax=Conidiobolus coronatus (strain ATCC 28846 / CBS 209.66 / NRRL 28638) TaxID=796925 RepID=A0A137NSJ3_CONC2|nr:hypothetical protein CONCODRAFT_12602 [Conidiobolus coronatus NRRL 28638]|eukprot:KXN65727.1 hypothetical protein CONCODRAFT_12602 [Conidiobolus coronatus NRRL 28638]